MNRILVIPIGYEDSVKEVLKTKANRCSRQEHRHFVAKTQNCEACIKHKTVLLLEFQLARRMSALIFFLATLVKEDVFERADNVRREVSCKSTRKQGFIVELKPTSGQSSR